MMRFITINRNEIFTSLVGLYRLQFKAKWRNNILKHLLTSHDLAPDELVIPLETLFARVYISHWFIDLYVSIREACKEHAGSCLSDYYEQDVDRQSFVYDNYLSLILKYLKPTHIFGLEANTLYIPVINTTYDWQNTSHNYFNIQDFKYNTDLFNALICLIRGSSFRWLTLSVPNGALGRPFWLLDWHKEKAYAWFPQEENYNLDDLNLALILGVPCTPLLASRDDDIPQQYPFNTNPRYNINFEPTRKVDDKRLCRWNDVRVIEDCFIDHPIIETIAIQWNEEESEDQLQSLIHGKTTTLLPPDPITQTSTRTYRINLFKIIDYKYYAMVIKRIDLDMRVEAHTIAIYKG